MAGDTDRRPFRASNSEMGSKPGGTESVPCRETPFMFNKRNKLMYIHLFGMFEYVFIVDIVTAITIKCALQP